MRRLPWALLAPLLWLLADPAAAVWYVYRAAPDAATVNGGGILFQVNDVGRTDPRLGETFQLSSTLSAGSTAASARRLFSDVTLTTDATGAVVAWTATGTWQSGFQGWTYDSSLQAGTFAESITYTPIFVGTPLGPFFSATPGHWELADAPIPIPEPASAALLLAGLAALGVRAARQRRSR